MINVTHRLVDASTVQSLHRTFCRTWIVVLDESVVEAFAVELKRPLVLEITTQIEFCGAMQKV